MDLTSQLLYQSVNGLVWGLIIALIALGLSLIFGLIEVVNVAHGSLYMLGAVLAWYVAEFTGSFWLALAVAPAAVGLVGLVVERVVLRPIEDRPIITIIATFGLLLIIQQGVLGIFGGAPRRIGAPFVQNFPLMGVGYPVYRVFVAIASLLAIGTLWAFLQWTKFGLWMRAVRQNREMALALGIPTYRVYMATFGLGSAMAALGGVLAAPIVTVEFQMGLKMLVTAFMVAVIGGLGSLVGSVIAALLIGELEGLLSVFIEPTYARVVSLLLMAVVLLWRPQGIMGKSKA